MAKRKTASKCKTNSQNVLKPSKIPKSQKLLKTDQIKKPSKAANYIPQPLMEPRRSKRNINVTPSEKKSSINHSKQTPLNTPPKIHFTNRNIHGKSVTETPKSVQKSSRLQGTTRLIASFKLQNDPEVFENLGKKSRKISPRTPKKALDKTREASTSQIKLEESSNDVSFGSSDLRVALRPDPPEVRLRRSIRHASSQQIKLEESPANKGFGAYHDLAEETFDSLRKKSRNINGQTPKKAMKKTGRTLTSQIKQKESSDDVRFGAYDQPAVSIKPDPPAVPLQRSIRHSSSQQIKLEQSQAEKKFQKAPSQTSNKTLNTPKVPTKSPSKTSSRSRKRAPSTSVNVLSPVIKKRKSPIIENRSDIQITKESLHVSSVPKSLPCREKEFNDIYSFIESKIFDECGGCMYVWGCPGTGKTTTITKVIKCLQLIVQQKKLPSFECFEINGMQLTEPRQAYVQIYRQFAGETLPWEQAYLLLEKQFTSPDMNKKTTLLWVDELDTLCNRRQDVIYNLLDWSTKKAAKLIVVAVANTVDLPERLLKTHITSRLGLTRLPFQPYSHKQLQLIVQARLMSTNIFDSDALELVTRKVASMAGDCRRALDISRRAIEMAERNCIGTNDIIVSMTHVQAAFNDMITNPKVLAINKCSRYEKLFLQAVEAEVKRTGVDETDLFRVYQQFESICSLNGVNIPIVGAALRISSKLGSSRLLICDHSRAAIHQKIMLNVSHDDIYYSLHIMKHE